MELALGFLAGVAVTLAARFVWLRSNPNYGIDRDMQRLREMHRKWNK
jgi:hypothetical protein